jgi:hypothetical protein
MCPVRTEGYAIVSADGMIADRNRHMPDGLKIPADVRFFNDGLDSASLIVHGAHSHEQQGAVSDRRRRLVVTNCVATIADHPEFPNAKLWNPTGMSFAEVCKAMGVTSGKAAVTGGARVFGLFLASALMHSICHGRARYCFPEDGRCFRKCRPARRSRS